MNTTQDCTGWIYRNAGRILLCVCALLPVGFARAQTPARGDSFLCLAAGGSARRAHAGVSDLDYSRDFSLEVMLRMETFERGGRWGTFIQKGNGTTLWDSASPGFAVGTYCGNEGTYAKKIMAKVGDGTSHVTLTTSRITGQVHVAVTWTAATRTLALYANGTPVASGAGAGIVPASIANTEDLGIGISSYELRRNLLCARIWNRALTDAEIAAVANRFAQTSRHDLPAGFSTTALLSEWRMHELCDAGGDEGTTHLRDLAGTNHLELAGSARLVSGNGALTTVYPASGASGVGPGVVLKAGGGIATLGGSVQLPLQYSFEADTRDTFDSPELKASGWTAHFAEWKPVLKPGTAYYWRVRVRDSADSPAESGWSAACGFTTRGPRHWYARPLIDEDTSRDALGNAVVDEGVYGTQDGTSYENAFNGVSGVRFGEGGVQSGDTLYICGEHVSTRSRQYWEYPRYLRITESGYSADFPLTVRMDYVPDPGRLCGIWRDKEDYNAVTWEGPDVNGVYRTDDLPLTPAAQRTADGWAWLKSAGAATWEGNFGAVFAQDGTVCVKTTDGGDPSGRIFMPRSNVGNYVELGRSSHVHFRNCRFFHAPISPDIEKASKHGDTLGHEPVSTGILFDGCDLGYGVSLVLDMGMDDWIIRDCDIHHTTCGIYTHGKHVRRLLVERCCIHDIGEPAGFPNGDSHAIGVQNGDGHVFQDNRIWNTGGSAVEFWCASGPMTNMIVRNNYIHHTQATANTSSSAVVISGDNVQAVEGTRTGFRIYNNILAYTKGDGGSWRGWGISSNSKDHVECGNNTIYRTVHGIRFVCTNPVPGVTVKGRVCNTLIASPDMNYTSISGSTDPWPLVWDYNSYSPVANTTDGIHFSQDIVRDVHSLAGKEPALAVAAPEDPADFTPAWNSPLIDAGTALEYRSSDFFGNPIYGTPDIGAIEYQPPYVMGVNAIDTTADVRVYANGKFRNTAAPSGTSAVLSVAPAEGFPAGDYREWMNIRITEWKSGAGLRREWTESSPFPGLTGTGHSVGGLRVGRSYRVSCTPEGGASQSLGSLVADSDGRLQFSYPGDYSRTVTFVLAEASSESDTWYVRPYDGGPYGAGDGTSYGNAWRRFADVVWGEGGVKPGDTLYVCGFHTGGNGHYFPLKASGTEEKPIVIDGNCPEGDPGMIFGSYHQIRDGWEGPDEFGVYTQSRGGLANSFAYEDTGATGDPNRFKRLIKRTTPPDETWLPGSAWVRTTEDVKITYYRPTSGLPADHVVYVESGGGIHTAGQHHVTIRNLKIWGSNSSIGVRGSHGIRIENCDLRWAAHVAVKIDHGSDRGVVRNCHIHEVGNGIYAMNVGNVDSDDGNDDWYIGHNHIHHLSDGLAYGVEGDHHAIGWQNGDRVIVEHNHVHDGGGPMICFWIGSSGHQRNNVIRYNFVHDNPRYGEADNHWSKSGISLASGNLAQGDRWTENLVHHNIVARVGSRAIYTKTHSNTLGLLSSGLYHNVVLGTYAHWKNGKGNAYEAGGKAAYLMKNNVALDSALYQLFQNPPLPNDVPYDRSDITIHRNLYWMNAGVNRFSWDNQAFETLAGWQAGSLGLGYPQDARSLESSPRFTNASGAYRDVADFTPAWSSPLIDAAEALAAPVISEDILGNPIYGTPDIGAVEYQPPYVMGVDPIDVAANVRVYADGKFRNTARPLGVAALLNVAPLGGFPDADRREWMNIRILDWPSGDGLWREWTESSPLHGDSATAHSVGGLIPGRSYALRFSLGGDDYQPAGVFTADGHGRIEFAYSGGYATTVSFVLAETDADNTSPSIDSVTPSSPLQMREEGSETFEVYASDADGDALGYSWVLDGSPVGDSLSDFTWTAPRGSQGDHLLTVTVSDGRGGSDSFTWSINVTADDDGDGAAADSRRGDDDDDEGSNGGGGGCGGGGCTLATVPADPFASALPYLAMLLVWAAGRSQRRR